MELNTGFVGFRLQSQSSHCQRNNESSYLDYSPEFAHSCILEDLTHD